MKAVTPGLIGIGLISLFVSACASPQLVNYEIPATERTSQFSAIPADNHLAKDSHLPNENYLTKIVVKRSGKTSFDRQTIDLRYYE